MVSAIRYAWFPSLSGGGQGISRAPVGNLRMGWHMGGGAADAGQGQGVQNHDGSTHPGASSAITQ